jgi:hypothetical protein
MAHYAFLDENNIVTEVIVGIDETELIEGLDPETWYGNFKGKKCVRTSYNAASNGFRYNYAGIGYTFDSDADAFIAPRPDCGHKELFLNDLYRWNCQKCRLDAQELSNKLS